MNISRTIAVFFAGIFLFAACVRQEMPVVHSVNGTKESLNDYILLWRHCNLTGNYDSLVRCTRPFFNDSKRQDDTSSMLYSGMFIAQAFLFLEEMDSVKVYLDYISGYESSFRDPMFTIGINNIRGIYALKEEMNYARALACYQRGYNAAQEMGYTYNMAVFLANMVNIFYLKYDKYGMEYAQKLEALSHRHPDDSVMNMISSLAMAKMLLLNGEPGGALNCLKETSGVAFSLGYSAIYSMIYILMGDALQQLGQDKQAAGCYDKALQYAESAEPGTVSLTYLNKGKLHDRRGDVSEAIRCYLKGLEISTRNDNVEYRRELLHKLSDAYYRIGSNDVSLDYYKQYQAHLDSMADARKEQEFGNLLLSYQRVEAESLLKSKEVELLRANKRVTVTVLLSLVVAVIAFFIYMLYRRKQKMYKLLFSQHQLFMERLEHTSNAAKEAANDEKPAADGGKELYYRIETLMREEKFFKSPDITLDKIAEKLDTNRTYLSKAINTYSGMTFSAYVNMYRISEAVKILKAHGKNVVLKELAADLGYSSVSAFSKIFQKETGCTPGKYRDELLKNDDIIVKS